MAPNWARIDSGVMACTKAPALERWQTWQVDCPLCRDPLNRRAPAEIGKTDAGSDAETADPDRQRETLTRKVRCDQRPGGRRERAFADADAEAIQP